MMNHRVKGMTDITYSDISIFQYSNITPVTRIEIGPQFSIVCNYEIRQISWGFHCVPGIISSLEIHELEISGKTYDH
jgi:hypothetical protein